MSDGQAKVSDHEEANRTDWTRLILLRHGETSAPDRFHGFESDVGLGERGRRQAEALGAELARRRPPPDVVYCSAMRRARETAAAIAKACDLELQVVEPLHERRMGTLSGRRRDEALADYRSEMARWMAGDLTYARPGGESYAEVRDRAGPALRRLLERHTGETVVIVTHGVVIRVLLTSLPGGLEPGHFDRIGIDYTAPNDLLWDGERLRIVTLNTKPTGET